MHLALDIMFVCETSVLKLVSRIILLKTGKISQLKCATSFRKHLGKSTDYIVNMSAICFLKQLSHYRQAAETAQTDLAAEKVVSSGLQQEVRGYALWLPGHWILKL